MVPQVQVILLPPSVPVATSIGVEHDVPSTSTGLKRNITGVGIKLGTYDGSTCLETFLASVENFFSYLQLSEEDELFCLSTRVCGPAGQLLWELGPRSR